MALISVAEALAHVTAGLSPLDAELVAVEAARGRVLAEDLAARLTQPPFDASAMDGFAVRADDLRALPVRLKVIGTAFAGGGFDGEVGPGQAVRIFTGARLPLGADTVVIQEDTSLEGDDVTIKEAEAHRHIRPRGQDFRQGEMLLRRGTRLGVRDLMLAAAMNHAQLPVHRRPKVAILSTGDEVVPPGTEPSPDQIIASVGVGLAALIEEQGGEAMTLGIAKDTPESIVTLLSTGGAADMLVTIGGASVGERDLVAAALHAEGFDLVFQKIAMRPGKPLLFGRKGSQRVLGLPGNPVSALVTATVFLLPMLRGMLGLDSPDGRRGLIEAILDGDIAANGPREHYLRAVSAWTTRGERLVRPLPAQDSSLMADFARADCLIVLAPNAPALASGEQVSVLPL
jgi:molybdopterin molybdotransferase